MHIVFVKFRSMGFSVSRRSGHVNWSSSYDFLPQARPVKMFSVPRDPDASRVNGSALVALADAAMAGTRPPFTFSRSDLNDLCLAEPPTFAPVRPPSQSELDEHSKKAMESGKAVLNSQSAWEALFAKIVSPFSSVADFHAAYKSGVSPTDIAERVIKAIEASNATVPPLRAVVQSDPEDIRRQASESASRWKGGKQLGPLDGIFVSIKENFAVKGYEARQGTSFLCRGKPSDYDADLVARLREQGAIVIGMTNMVREAECVINTANDYLLGRTPQHELGWDISGINPFSGPSRNPYNLHRTAGGSSGGSAASVASGLVPISLGGDAGGSVRIPSAYCGLYGLKPTCGRLSLGPDGGSLSMATKGIHSATVGDLAVAVSLGTLLPIMSST